MQSLKDISSDYLCKNLTKECIDSIIKSYTKNHTVYTAHSRYYPTINEAWNCTRTDHGHCTHSNEKPRSMIFFLHEVFSDEKTGFDYYNSILDPDKKPYGDIFFIPHILSPLYPIDKVYLISVCTGYPIIHVTNNIEDFRKISSNFELVNVVNCEDVTISNEWDWDKYISGYKKLMYDEPYRWMVTVNKPHLIKYKYDNPRLFTARYQSNWDVWH